MKLRPARLFPVLVIGAVAPVLVPSTSPAAPIDDLRAQAEELTTDLEENGAKVAALGEKLNAAQIEVDEAQATIDDSNARIAAAEVRIAELRALIAARAAAAYRTAGTAGPLDIISTENVSDATVRSKYTDSAAAKDDALVDQLGIAKEDLDNERAAAEQARDVAREERDGLAAAKAEADAAAAEQEQLLSQVEGEIADLVAEERARREAAAAAAAPAPTATPAPSAGGDDGGGSAAPAPGGPPPSASGGAGAAVGYAWAQVGKPYCYAGTGPGCYDCSGLTMMAWAQGGISMPHYSGAQGSMFPAVPISGLQPGDLITTSSWSAHVGIWVGGGYVHATHTGDFIRFVPGSGSVVAAVRPG